MSAPEIISAEQVLGETEEIRDRSIIKAASENALDHEKLTYRFDGRDYRLTDVAGRVVDEIIA